MRLTWHRDGKTGFVAYPEGEHLKDRRAEIRYDATSATKWAWFAHYDGARESGAVHDKQTAANRVNERWPVVKRNGLVRAAEAAEEAVLETNVRRMMAKGDLPLSVFEVATADGKRLVRILDLVRAAGGLNGPAKPLVEACSAELFRRRCATNASQAGY
jgi:hypothetical protein